MVDAPEALEGLTVAATENKALTEEDVKIAQAINELLTVGGELGPFLYRHDSEPPTGHSIFGDDYSWMQKAAHTGKRGRPRKYVWDEYLRNRNANTGGYGGASDRVVQNRANASSVFSLLGDLEGRGVVSWELIEFFSHGDADSAAYKHQGILEQIGRMLNGGLINEFHAVQLAKRAAYLCEYSGYRSKDVERMLRYVHKEMKDALKK